MIVDYTFYLNNYGDAVPSEELFNKLAEKAENYLAYYMVNGTPQDNDKTKKCLCEMVDVLLDAELTPTASESLGGWSVSGISYNVSAKLNSIINRRLFGEAGICQWL